MIIEVVLVEDHPLYSIGLQRIIDYEPDMTVVSSLSNGRNCVDVVQRLQPQIAIIDVNLPDENGIQLTNALTSRRGCRNTRVIILTGYDDEGQMLYAFRSGASAYLTKDVASEEIVRAVRVVAAGNNYIKNRQMDQGQLTSWLNRHLRKHSRLSADHRMLFSPLSKRQVEILHYIAQGNTNQQISDHLGIENSTVKNHVSDLLRKLNVTSRTEAAALALRRGWVR